MDFATFEAPETATIHIEHPKLGKLYSDDARKKPVTIDVYGPASDVAVKFARDVMKRVSERMGKRGRNSSLSPEEIEDMAINRLVAHTAKVDGIEFNDEAVTLKNIEAFYRNPSFGWVREQVAIKLESWEDFLA